MSEWERQTADSVEELDREEERNTVTFIDEILLQAAIFKV